MKIVEQGYRLEYPTELTPEVVMDLYRRIEVAGRTCYKSEPKGTDEDTRRFVRMIAKRKHLSVLEHVILSVRIVTDRGVSHEHVRHRIGIVFSQESTRYCDYEGGDTVFVDPVDFELTEEDLGLLLSIEAHYKKRRAEGLSPQQARYFLPNGLKTEYVVTANLREWQHIFALRCSEAAHPQIRALLLPLLHELQTTMPEVFGSLEHP